MTFNLARKVHLDVASTGHFRISGFDDPDYLVMLVEKAAGVKSAKSVQNDAMVYFEPYNAKKALDSVTAELNNVRIPHEVVGILASKIESFAKPKPVMMTGGKQTLDISQIRRDGGTQPRAEIDTAKVEEYISDMADGAEFPPVVVFYDGSSYWLADGFHRVQAAQKNLRQSIMAEVHQGTQREAILYSVGANATHGLKRSNEDKRRAVARLLNDEEWGKWSNHEIARKCKVSDVFVGKMRSSIITDSNLTTNVCSEVTFVNKHGDEVTMQTANIGAKKVIPDSLLWLPERLRKAVINGYFNLSVDHLQALSPLEGLNTIGAPMLGVSTFDKHTDIPTPQALYNRLSTIGGLSADEVEAVVSRMVAVCKPSPNEVDLSDFTEADFAELGAAGEGEPSEKRLDETGIKGYFFVNGGKAVWCEFTDKTLTLDEFEEIKAKHAKPRKSASHSNGNGSSGHTRTAEQVHGDSLAAGISRGYVAQAERANGERADMVRELGKMSEDALNLLSAAIAKAIGFNDTVFNPISYIADFVMSEVSGEVQS